ncbi:Lysophospholipase, alpha-beta hydrolase superfamily [Corynebacterium mycetoides]|uniref:Lysophospholipase, alpha-beta hydrolase superfamily n=1 Tax=Corynebacterium mycetoides TaxID=38302 RepID=A0A1G9N1B8_9CORY|nr:alpha/beta hydrolase [Corynebacterium mycetoides]SDL79655.1 Lysophospholipase, alpha-beta hydrolase superfamily [Corynebacterium mycetoides]
MTTKPGASSSPSSDEYDSLEWSDDVLGDGFESVTLTLAPDGDDSGKRADSGTNRAVLVRALPDAPTGKPALLWVHGMSDYFFQAHVARHYVSKGYPFYALDLRRCGRAHRSGEPYHYTTDLSHYFPELSRSLDIISSRHGTLIPLAHSTGGLIVPLWADDLRSKAPEAHSKISGIILNSPWLDMQFPRPAVAVTRPVVGFLGKRFPRLPIPVGGLSAYGESISSTEHGEWDFNTEWKPVEGHGKYVGWLRAVFEGQKPVHAGEVDTGVPMLTLVSSHSYLSKPYSPAADTADTVLDVDQIRRWAPTLSSDSEVEVIDGARHDVFLSERHAREAAFAAVDAWLEEQTEGQVERH